MRRSVFGAKFSKLGTKEGIAVLEESGYKLGFFPSPRNLETQRKIFETGITASLDVIGQYLSLSHATLEFIACKFENMNMLILDILFNSPAGVDFFRSQPKEEVSQFVHIVLPHLLEGRPIPIVTSTCPDYEPRSYRLRDGVGLFAERTIRGVDSLNDFFSRRSVVIDVDMHLADGDAADPIALASTGETRESFLQKTGTTVSRIRQVISGSGKSSYMSVMPMSSIFGGVDGYKHEHEKSIQLIQDLYKQKNKKVCATIDSLMRERKRLGDFDSIKSEEQQIFLVIGELAGYVTYGKQIDGEALVVSPGAKSVVPAYNFGVTGQNINPIIYIYDKKEKINLFTD